MVVKIKIVTPPPPLAHSRLRLVYRCGTVWGTGQESGRKRRAPRSRWFRTVATSTWSAAPHCTLSQPRWKKQHAHRWRQPDRKQYWRCSRTRWSSSSRLYRPPRATMWTWPIQLCGRCRPVWLHCRRPHWPARFKATHHCSPTCKDQTLMHPSKSCMQLLSR